MDIVRDFMSRVVPWPVGDGPGFVNLHWLRPRLDDPSKMGWSGKPTRTLDTFLDNARWGTQQTSVRDIYFCLSLQSETALSKKGFPKPVKNQANALALRAIWLDVDVKPPPKGYADLTAAIAAITDFVTKAGLPPPSALVASGGGVHVYWFSNRALTRSEWQPYANGLKNAALNHGLLCDAGVTGDSARVLRVPGTFNYKTEPRRAVRVLGLLPAEKDYDFAHSLAGLLTVPVAHSPVAGSPTPAGFDLSGFPKGTADAIWGAVDSLAVGLEREQLPPLAWAPLFKECAFFRDALTTGGEKFAQPEWNYTTLISTWLEDGDALAHRMGNRHPGYTPDSTDELLERKKRERASSNIGWPSCSAIHAAGYGGCAGCPHLSKGKSPLNYTTPPVLPAVTAAVTAAAPPAMMLPDGYIVDRDGNICLVQEIQVKDQAPVTEYLKLFTCTLTAPWAQRNPDAINFTTTVDLGNTRMVSLPMVEITGGLDMWKALLRQGVKAYPPNKKHVETYLMAWITRLHNAQAALGSLPFGWYEENGKRVGFIYGGVIMMDDGSERPAGFGDHELREVYKPTGELAPWFECLKVVTDQKRPEFEVMVASSFAGPLMVSTGEYTGVLSSWGDSGAGKSTAVKVAQAVWSHPKKTKEVVMSTPKSVVQKLATIRHLPLYWDEIKDAEMQKKVFSAVFGTEGVSPSRLFANITFQPRGDWQTMLAICSNISFIDYINSIQKTTAAGMYRVLEYHVDQRPISAQMEIEVSRLMQTLESNFGVIGMRYAKYLGSNPVTIDLFVRDTCINFSKQVESTGGERIWVALAGTVIAGAVLANQLGATFNIDLIRKHMVTVFMENRKRVKDANVEGGSVDNTEEVLTGFLKLYIAHTVYTNTYPRGAGKPKVVTVKSGPRNDNPKPIYVQFCTDDRLIRISRTEFVAYLNRLQISPYQIVQGLIHHYKAAVVSRQLCAGTPYRCGQENLIHIPVPANCALEHLLGAHEQGGTGEAVDFAPPPVDLPAVDAMSAMAQAAKDLELVRSRT